MFNLENGLKNAKSSMVVALVLTLINTVILFLGYFDIFVINLSFPYSVFTTSIHFVWAIDALSTGYVEMGIFYAATAIIVTGLFVAPLLIIKTRPKWLIAAAIAVIIDTVYMVYIYMSLIQSNDYLFDLLFHGWLLVTILLGIVAAFKAPKVEKDPFENL
jgi:hypothetical protein